MKLDGEVLSSMRTARVFADNTNRINAIDFSSNGELCVTSANDQLISVYNCVDGSQEKQLPAKKYGASQIRFTHDNKSVIHASNVEWSDDIRYLSLHDLRYLRYFKGHRKAVVSMAMSPASDHFTSGSLDGTVRFWDVRVPQCQGLIRTRARRPVVAYDPAGAVFAAGVGENTVKLYDVRNVSQGPFATFNQIIPNTQPEVQWSQLTFSPDGNYILAATLDGQLLLIDAYQPGHVVQRYAGHQNSNNLALEACFSADAQYVLSGSEDGVVYAWNTLEGGTPHKLIGHQSVVQCVRWNPKKMMLASGCCSLAFWLPTLKK